MKRAALLLCISVLSIPAIAQDAGGATGQSVGEDTRSMVLGSKNAFFIDFSDVSSSFVEKGWKDFIGTYGKVKKVKKSDEMIVEGAQIVGIGGVNMLNLYTRTESSGTGARHYLWIQSGNDFVSSATDKDAANNAKELLREFAHKIKVDLITIELDEQQKALDDLDKDLQKLRKEKDKLHDVIEDAKQRIAEAEADIVKNIQDQEIRVEEIERQRKVVDEVKTRLESARMRKS